jgi:hypothetical protein
VTDHATPLPDDFDAVGFKEFCAAFGIEAKPVTDAFGRIDFELDRTAVEKIWALKQLADDYVARGGQ